MPYNCQLIIITTIFMAPGSWILPSFAGEREGRKKTVCLLIVLVAFFKQPSGLGPERQRAASSAGLVSPLLHLRYPRATSSLARPARARMADLAPPPRPLTNLLSNPPWVEIAAANALWRRESPQQIKKASLRLEERRETWKVRKGGLIGVPVHAAL